MSWRTGSKLFLEIWPLIQSNLTNPNQRIEFTARLIKLFVDEDMDTWDIEDVDPDIRRAIELAGYNISESERYSDEV